MLKRFLIILLFLFAITAAGQEMYQKGNATKVINTSMDTVLLPGKFYSVKKGIITNEDIAYPLYVYFAYPGSVRLDSNSLVMLPAGRTLTFSTEGRCIFRKSNWDNGYKTSQVILGRNIDMGFALERCWNEFSFDGIDFSGQVIRDWDLSGCIFTNCTFTNAKFINCLFVRAYFPDCLDITDEQLREAARQINVEYEFDGIEGGVINIPPLGEPK